MFLCIVVTRRQLFSLFNSRNAGNDGYQEYIYNQTKLVNFRVFVHCRCFASFT